ncbi:MAG: 2-isopropylmalate synthase, partial [Clostridiales Family XIII bacterium]|nr:2-isopropylmalate synthase [Clostridiales Family XIII bacterium]
IYGENLELIDYQLSSVTEGDDALGNAFVVIKNAKNKKFFGKGLSTDIIEASIFAYINAINKMLL